MIFPKSIVLAGATVALAIPASAAFGAVAALEDDQLVSAPIESLEARMDTLQSFKPRVTRFGIMWNEVARTQPANPTDPNDPAYDWTRTDILVRGMAKRGINPIIAVYSTPTWSSGGRHVPDTQYNPFAPAPGDLGKFMQAAATRYSGRFTPAFAPSATTSPGTPLPTVRLWEVWNEPNLKRFLRTSSGRTSLPVYLRMVRESYPAIKRGNPRAIVLAGSTGPRGTNGDGSLGARTWLTGLARSPLNVKFDAYSQHIYPSTGPTSKRKTFPSWTSFPDIFTQLDLRRDRQIRAARGAAKAKLKRMPPMRVFITEAGYTTATTQYRANHVSLASQAKFIKQIFTLKVVRNPRVPVVVLFNMQDNPDWPGGLLTVGDSPKPAAAAFRSVARRGSLPPELRR